jgi:HAD superfamily hydrolase (TIGR01490 family)
VSIAFFDLDRTLIATNSGALWVLRELQAGHITSMQAARASLWLFRYTLGFAAMETALGQAIASLQGQVESEVRARTHRFYEADVRPLFRPGAMAAVRQHRAAGDRLVLLTTSSVYLSEKVAEELAFDAILCNRFEVDAQGRYTGLPQGALCFGPGKLVHAEAYAQSVGERLEESVFYSDSYSDLPVFDRVGRAVAVNPDQRLRRHAQRQGWTVTDWGTPPGARTGWGARLRGRR